MARRSQLEGRLLAILDGHTQRGHQGAAATVVAVVLAIALMAPLAAVRAQSQAEQNAPPEVAATILAANAQKNHEILDQAAVTYEQLRKFAEAQQLREASLAIVEQQSGQLSKDYAVALVKLGDLARKRGAWQESTDYYNKALALGDRPEAFTALINLGRDGFRGTVTLSGAMRVAANAIGNLLLSTQSNSQGQQVTGRDPAKALEYLTRARNVASNGNDMATALTWLAMVHQSQPDGGPEAETLYRGAMAAAAPDSAEQALALEFYSNFLKSQDRAAEAGPLESRAQVIRQTRVGKMGPKQVSPETAIKVGPGVKAPTLLFKVEPAYSEEARAAKLQGTVRLKVTIDVDGLAKDISVVSGQGLGLDEQAVTAILQWKFNPGQKDGVPIPVLATIEVNFKLL
jgi:TonB family protein